MQKTVDKQNESRYNTNKEQMFFLDERSLIMKRFMYLVSFLGVLVVLGALGSFDTEKISITVFFGKSLVGIMLIISGVIASSFCVKAREKKRHPYFIRFLSNKHIKKHFNHPAA